MARTVAFLAALAIAGCSPGGTGHVVRERPTVLDHPGVVKLDSAGDGAQVQAFLAAHAARRTGGLCEGMLSEELTPSVWCIVTEAGNAYLVIDYTGDPLGVDGFRIQPLQYKGENRFYDAENRRKVRLLPWSKARAPN